MSEIYVCYAWDKKHDIYDSLLYLLKIGCSLNESGELVWETCTHLSSLFIDLKDIIMLMPEENRLPDVYTDDKGIIRLKAYPKAAEYNRYNPMGVLPFKSGFFRTITVIGATRRENPTFRKFNMTNRTVEILDEHYCDYRCRKSDTREHEREQSRCLLAECS